MGAGGFGVPPLGCPDGNIFLTLAYFINRWNPACHFLCRLKTHSLSSWKTAGEDPNKTIIRLQKVNNTVKNNLLYRTKLKSQNNQGKQNFSNPVDKERLEFYVWPSFSRHVSTSFLLL